MATYGLDAFAGIPSAKEIVTGKVNLDTLPAIEQVRTLAKWTPEMVELFERPYDPNNKTFDRSATMSRFAYSGAELNWTDEQIVAALYDLDTRWEKYTGRKPSTRDNIIFNMVNRAREKHGYTKLGDIDFSRFGKAVDDPSPSSTATQLVWGFQDFLDADFRVDWLLENMLPQQGVGLIVGKAGTGKTQFALQLACSLALGHDRFLRWNNVSGKKKVLFLSLEMGPGAIQRFISTVAETYPDRQTLNKNFLLMPQGEALPLDKEAGQNFLNNILDEFMPDIIVIDSLVKVMSGKLSDELSARDLFAYLGRVRNKYRTAILIVAHPRKDPNDKSEKSPTELSDVYGSTYLTTDADFVLSLSKVSKNILGVTMLKSRLGEEVEPFEIMRDKNLHFTSDFEEDMIDRFTHKSGIDRKDLGLDDN